MGIGLILLFYILNKASYLYNTSITSGKFLGYDVIYDEGRKKSPNRIFPTFEYQVNDKVYKVNGIENLHIEEGEIIEFIYKNDDPEDAYQYSFFGFWYYGILYSVIGLVLLTIICYGFLDEKHSIKIKIPFYKTPPTNTQLPDKKTKN